MKPSEDSSQCPMYYKVFTLWTSGDINYSQHSVSSKNCFPIVPSLAFSRSFHHIQIKTQPKAEGEPSADLQHACTLEFTSIVTYTQYTCPSQLPSPSTLPCNSHHLGLPKLLSVFLSQQDWALLWSFLLHCSLWTTSWLYCKLCNTRAYLVCFHSQGSQFAATCHLVSKNHCWHIYMFSSCL